MHMHMHEHATSPPLLKQKFPILLVVPQRINTTHHPIRCMRSHLSLATYTPLSLFTYTHTPVSVFLLALLESVSC